MYRYAPQKQTFVDGKSVIVPHVRRKNDNNKIIQVLNSTKKHESHKLKNVHEIYLEDDNLVIECVEKVKYGYIPTKHKIKITTYLYLLSRYKRDLPMIDYYKEEGDDVLIMDIYIKVPKTLEKIKVKVL